MIKKIEHNGTVLAIVIPADYSNEGIDFFTPSEYSQQMAYMKHDTGHVILPHIHNHVERQIVNTQEVLILKKGILRVDFYTDNREYIFSTMISEGDIIMLVSGGHGFKVIDSVEMIEIKQGPYLGEIDKKRFESDIEGNITIV